MNASLCDYRPEDAVIDDADAPDLIFDSPTWQHIAATSHKRARALTAAERRRADNIPDFDDPDLLVKLHTESAPLRERAALFIRLWNSFPLAVRSEFLADVTGRTR